MVRGVAQPGSAPVLGTGGRRFESSRPDHQPVRLGSKAAHYVPPFVVFGTIIQNVAVECFTFLLPLKDEFGALLHN